MKVPIIFFFVFFSQKVWNIGFFFYVIAYSFLTEGAIEEEFRNLCWVC